MDRLEEARQIINEVDSEMAQLFAKRMKAVQTVARYKQEHGMPIFDSTREKAVLARNAKLISDESIKSFYVRFLQDTMNISKQYQHQLLEGMKIAYSGVEGAFACIAAGRIFPDGKLISYSNFEPAYQAVVDGECDCCVLPLENSFAGEVGQVMDLMFRGSLFVTGVYDLPVVQNLIGLPGTRAEDITEVVSHPQALSQCAAYIAKHGYGMRQSTNTALAAKEVAQKGDPGVAAIASVETASLYGLQVIERSINENTMNTTRFAVFSRTPAASQTTDGFLLMFRVGNVAGALAAALNIIAKYGYNMKVLRSRPVKDIPWQYYFYVEADGNENTADGRNMLLELQQCCADLKVVGHYVNDLILKEEA